MANKSETIQKKSSGRGGARKGAGRKPGSANVKTRAIADKAAQEGITPLEVMLDNMRFAHNEAGALLAKLLSGGAEPTEAFDALKELLRYRGMAQEAAKDAAPYLHPRLSSVEMNAKVTTHEASLDDLA
jgi:hypothetical protein